MVFASPLPSEPSWMAPLPAISGGLCQVLLALLFNNLTRMPYPRRRSFAPDNHQTQDPAPGARVGIQAADLDQALDELAPSSTSPATTWNAWCAVPSDMPCAAAWARPARGK